MANIYITSLSYHPSTPSNSSSLVNHNISTTFAILAGNASLEVRTGYFALCVSDITGLWVCSNDAAGLARQYTLGQDPLNLIAISAKIKDGIIFGGLMYVVSISRCHCAWRRSYLSYYNQTNGACIRIAAIALTVIVMIILASFPGWHEELDENGEEKDVKPFPSRPLVQCALALSALATAFAFVSSLWQHIAAVAAATVAQSMAYGTVESHIGAASVSLGWAGLGLMVVTTIGLAMTISSLDVITNLVDE